MDHHGVLMSSDPQAERQRLVEIASWYTNRDWGFYTKLVHMGFRSLEPHFADGSCLEVGPADGEMTRFLAERFDDLTVVDAAERYVLAATAIRPGIEGHVSLIEDWRPSRRYDNIVFAHVLEHVAEPLAILEKLSSLLSDRGRLCIIVPNALSLHRLVGVKMGMLTEPTDLNDADISVGHRRVYTSEGLRADIGASGLSVEAWGGIFIKPLANAQIQDQWSDALIEGYFLLGRDLPELCSELYAVCFRR
jgi:trans-aconitate methyltransferase